MARITVEDCLDNVDNRFQLVLVATKRARQLSRGAEPRVARENDKPTVLALREIAEALTGPDVLDEHDGPIVREPEVPEPGIDLTAEIAAEFARAEQAEDEDDDLDLEGEPPAESAEPDEDEAPGT